MIRKLAIPFIATVSLFLLAEGGARYWLGLGNPPLTQRDPEIDFLFVPGKTYSRFGNRVSYNSYSMRSADPPENKAPETLRVLVMGDSVINGGSLTDQNELATEIASSRLGSKTWIGNVSAGSWGPENLIAYGKKFGWFEADIIVVVLSTHDLNDVRDFQHDLGASFPNEVPLLALIELFERYLPRYLPKIASASTVESSTLIARSEERSERGEKAVRQLVRLAKNHTPCTAVILHPTMIEQRNLQSDDERDDRRRLLNIIREEGIGVIDLLCASNLDPSTFRDNIHLNAAGQTEYAGVIFRIIRSYDSCP